MLSTHLFLQHLHLKNYERTKMCATEVCNRTSFHLHSFIIHRLSSNFRCAFPRDPLRMAKGRNGMWIRWECSRSQVVSYGQPVYVIISGIAHRVL